MRKFDFSRAAATSQYIGVPGVSKVRLYFLLHLSLPLLLPSIAISAETQQEVLPQSTTAAAVRRGKIMYLQCRACHSINVEDGHLIGPNLAGIFGDVAGTKKGFIYSEAAASSDVVWTAETLDAFLKKPDEFFPGTKMAFVGIANADDRQALISYLEANVGK